MSFDSLVTKICSDEPNNLIIINNASNEQVSELQRLGFNFDVLRRNCDPTTRGPEYYHEIAQAMGESIQLTIDQEQLSSQKKFHLGLPTYRDSLWQQVVIENGYAYTYCPLSGQPLKSNKSFVVSMRGYVFLLYFFEGKEPFFLVSGSIYGFEYGVYYPNLNICVQYYNCIPEITLADTVLEFKSLTRNNVQLVEEYLSKNQKNGNLLINGVSSNMAHHVWQELTGLHFLSSTLLTEKINFFLFGPHDYFNMAAIFPEINKSRIIRLNESPDQLFSLTLLLNTTSCFCFHPKITKVLQNRIVEVATKYSSPETTRQIKHLKKKYPVIWFGIRSNYRRWINQIEGISSVINSLHKDYPNLAVILDGWSRVPGYDNMPLHQAADGVKKPQEMVTNESRIIDEIRRRVSSNVLSLSLVDQMTYDKVLYATSSDLFVCPFSSGDTYTARVAGIQGVYHTNVAFGGYAQQEIPVWGDSFNKKVVACNIVQNHSDPFQIHHSNYELSPDILKNEILITLQK